MPGGGESLVGLSSRVVTSLTRIANRHRGETVLLVTHGGVLDVVNRFVREGSELLTTITNDAWFGRSSAAAQHFEQASLRAVEQARYLVRAANTGISGVVDPYGRVLQRTGLFETATVVQEVRFLRERTIYSRIGDVVAYLSLLLTAGALVAPRRRPAIRP